MERLPPVLRGDAPLESSKLGVLAVLRLDGDEMTADPDDGDAGDASKTYMAICSTSDEVGDIIG